MHARAAYDELIRQVRQEALLDSCAALLAWDEETYMPPGGTEHRGRQMALLAGLCHDRAADPRIGDLLTAVERSDLVGDPLSSEAVNVREIRRLHERSLRLPRALVEELARVTSMAQQEWAGARLRADFAHFRPWLEHVSHLKRSEAESLSVDNQSYDSLLEEYEPGARSGDLTELFEALRRTLAPLVAALTEAPRRPNPDILHRPYPLDSQQRFSQSAAAAIGFDFERGRLDTTAHPFFITIGPADCRLTRASIRTISAADSSPPCTRRATVCTNRDCDPSITARRWARPSRWGCTNRRPACGKTSSAAACLSGDTSSPSLAAISARRWPT